MSRAAPADVRAAGASRLRSERDELLAEQILAEPIVRRALRRLREEEARGAPSVRRSLLARAVRLAPTVLPDVTRLAERCAHALGIDAPLEAFVYPGAEFNAAAVKPEAGRLFVLLSSSLLEAFRGGELAFVLGHELGHHLFGHHEIPTELVFEGEHPRPELVLRLFAWSRYAEISADRAGAACADDPDAVGRALFRLASGLRGDLGSVSIDELAEQAESLRYESSGAGSHGDERDWLTTHPYSPLRLEALRLFHRSDLLRGDGISRDELEASVQESLAVMEPSYLEERSDVAEVMRRLLLAGAVAIAQANGEISEAERSVLDALLGRDTLDARLDLESVAADPGARTARAREIVPRARRVQVLRDLVLVAKADGVFRAAEVALLRRIAEELDVPSSLAISALCERCEID